jgi:hypothetical protein
MTDHASNTPNPQHLLLTKQHLIEHGHIWSWEAIELYDNTRLAACIHILKKQCQYTPSQLVISQDL